MISLNGVVLSDDLFWDNEFSVPLISQQQMRTVLGRSIIHTAPLQGGRILILKAARVGNNIQGYFTREQVQQFKILESTGQQVQLIYESEIINVIIKAGGVNVIPHIERPNSLVTDEYSGTLTLIEV